MKVQEQGCYGIGSGFVQVASWFVADQKVWALNEGSCDGDSLLFSPGKLCGFVIDPLQKANVRDQRFRIHNGLFRGRDQRGQKNILQHRTLGQQAMILKHKSNFRIAKTCETGRIQLENIPAPEKHSPAGGGLQATEDVEESALPGTGWPHDRGGISRCERKVDIREDCQYSAGRGVLLSKVGDLKLQG